MHVILRVFLGVISFNGKHGCQKCTIVGEYSYISHTTFFPRSNCPKRTNEGFRLKQYDSHHKNDTPLTELPIDMIDDFPIADSLHLIDLGIMKRCLLGWRDGSFGNYKTKWSCRDITKVSEFLKQCRMPSEIHRAVRGIDCLAHWKGLEYRTFLHYISIVILKYVLPCDVYEHFLLFFCAVTICSSNKYFKLLNSAEALLLHYVETFRDHYGEDFMSSNVHNLTHLVDDVKKFGELASFSAYPFESKLYQIKNLLRNGNRPLVQVAKRLGEIAQVETEIPIIKNKTPVLKGKCLNSAYFVKVQFEKFRLTTDSRDKWFLSNNNEIVSMNYACQENGEIVIDGTRFTNTKNFFGIPIKSSHLHIYSIDNMDLETSSEEHQKYTVSEVKCKMVAVHDTAETIFLPLLHTV